MGTLQLALIFPGPNECVYVCVCTHVCVCVWVCARACVYGGQKSQFSRACANGLVTPLGV